MREYGLLAKLVTVSCTRRIGEPAKAAILASQTRSLA